MLRAVLRARLRTGLAPALGLSLALAAPAARAEFIVCNRSFDVINVAIGTRSGGGNGGNNTGGGDAFRTEGWWTIGTNQCADVIKTRLSNRFVYVYATDVFGQPLLDGHSSMCIAPKRFAIDGIDGCWQRGHIAAPFLEVDTRSASDWTLYIRQPEGS